MLAAEGGAGRADDLDLQLSQRRPVGGRYGDVHRDGAVGGQPQGPELHRLPVGQRFDVQVRCPIEHLGGYLRDVRERLAVTRAAVGHVAQPVVVRGDGKCHHALRVGPHVGAVAGVVVELDAGAERRLHGQAPGTAGVIVERHQEVGVTLAFVDDGLEVLESADGSAEGQVLMDPHEIVDERLSEITPDLGRARDISHLLTDIHGLLSELCLDGTRPEFADLAQACLRDCDSPYTPGTLISALDEVITQLIYAMRDAAAQIQPPACQPSPDPF